MSLNAKTIQRITGVNSSDAMHSSGFAQAQNSGAFGVASNDTFSARQQLAQNRKMVGKYEHSHLAQRTNMAPRAQTVEQQAQAAIAAAQMNQQGSTGSTGSLQAHNSRLERGGLRQFDTRGTAGINRTGIAKPAVNSRQEMAGRFAAKARPAPKTGGFGR